MAGTLGELKAPGAASQKDDDEKEGTEGAEDKVDADGDEVKKEPKEDGEEADKRGETPAGTVPGTPAEGDTTPAPKDAPPSETPAAPEKPEAKDADDKMDTDKEEAVAEAKVDGSAPFPEQSTPASPDKAAASKSSTAPPEPEAPTTDTVQPTASDAMDVDS